MDASSNLGYVPLAIGEKYVARLPREPLEKALIDQKIRSDYQKPLSKLSARNTQHFPRVDTSSHNELDFLSDPPGGQRDRQLRWLYNYNVGDVVKLLKLPI